jgi:hypothetical protein
LAVADFALLYDPHRHPGGEPHGMANLLIKADTELGSHDPEAVTKLREHAEKYWEDHGHPVAPPFLPEAISKDHHDPYLVNYKHEPIPLRIGKSDSNSIKRQKTQADAKPGDDRNPGDMASAFDSTVHGDPFTEIFEGYEGSWRSCVSSRARKKCSTC